MPDHEVAEDFLGCALLFMTPLFRKHFGENVLVDQVGVSADTAEVARRPLTLASSTPSSRG